MLRIRYPYLEAIEDGRVGELPGPTYAVGFVRAYADYLGLESGQIVSRFKEETKGLGTRTSLVFPSPLPEGKIPSGAVLLLAVIFAMAVYGGWIYLSGSDRPIASVVPQLPDRLAALIGQEPEPTAKAAPLQDTATDSSAPADVPAVVPDSGASAAPPETMEQAVPPAAAADAEMKVTVVTADPPAEPTPDAAAAASVVGPNTAAAASVVEPDSTASASAVENEPSPANTEAASPPTEGAAATGQAASVPAPSLEEKPNPASRQESELPPPPSLEPQISDAAPPRPAMETPTPTADASMEPGNGASDAAAATTTVAMVPQRTAQVFGQENENARIVIRAEADSWIEVRAPGGEILLTRVLRAGDVYRVPDQAGLTLITGNAGGLAIAVDGKPVPRLGPVGSVRRNVALDVESLRNGAGTFN